MNTSSFEDQARIFKALGHPSRLTMAHALLGAERSVGELQALVGADISTVSKHLTVLKDAGIVADRKQGATVLYHLTLGCLAGFLTCTADAVRDHAVRDHAARDHAARDHAARGQNSAS